MIVPGWTGATYLPCQSSSRPSARVVSQSSLSLIYFAQVCGYAFAFAQRVRITRRGLESTTKVGTGMARSQSNELQL